MVLLFFTSLNTRKVSTRPLKQVFFFFFVLGKCYILCSLCLSGKVLFSNVFPVKWWWTSSRVVCKYVYILQSYGECCFRRFLNKFQLGFLVYRSAESALLKANKWPRCVNVPSASFPPSKNPTNSISNKNNRSAEWNNSELYGEGTSDTWIIQLVK